MSEYGYVRELCGELGCECEPSETICLPCSALEEHRQLEKQVATLTAERDGLKAALEAVHDWRGLCDVGQLETWERIASMFYDDTGMLRPGKDQAAALGGYPTDEERRKAWDAWVKRKNNELDATICAALQGVRT